MENNFFYYVKYAFLSWKIGFSMKGKIFLHNSKYIFAPEHKFIRAHRLPYYFPQKSFRNHNYLKYIKK